MRKAAAFSLACAATALLTGCATTVSSPSYSSLPKYTNQLHHFDDLRVGMTQAEVLEVMGSSPLRAETLRASDGQPFIEWRYCATHEATNTNEFAWLVFKDQKLSSTDSMLSHAAIDGRIVDCAAIVKQGYSNAVAASQRAAAEARARAEAEARVEAKRKEERARRTAAAAAALNAFAEGMAQGSQPSSGASQAPPSSNATSATPLLLYADNLDRTFLGCLNCNKYNSSSVFNEYGEYGGKYSDTSIRNQYSEFGSRYSTVSACNPYASNPPFILDNDGDYYGRFTMNRYADDAANSDYFRRLVALLCRD